MGAPGASASEPAGAAADNNDALRRGRWPERIQVGRVVRPHGVRGEVALEPWGELGRHVRLGSELQLGGRSGTPRRLTSVRGAHDRLIGSIEGCSDRDAAAEFRGAVLEIASQSLPLPRGDEFYLFELEGCEVLTQAGAEPTVLGRVQTVVEDGGGLILEVRAAADSEPAEIYLVPFVAAYLQSMDLSHGRLIFDLPEGLLETCVSTL